MTLTRVPVAVDTRGPGGRTNAYVVGADGALLVDPAAATDRLTAAVGRRTVDHIAVTHTHPDHVGAVAHYAEACGATVWAHADFGDRFERAVGVAPDRTFRDGTAVGPAIALATPGHAPDHVAFVVDDAALAGDLVFAETSAFVGGDGADVGSYLDSIDRVRDRELTVLHPGHGPSIREPAVRLAWARDHRLDREARVLEAVRSGAHSPDEITDGAYDRDLTGVRDMARLSVEAHLDKLAAEGRVRWDGERATPA